MSVVITESSQPTKMELRETTKRAGAISGKLIEIINGGSESISGILALRFAGPDEEMNRVLRISLGPHQALGLCGNRLVAQHGGRVSWDPQFVQWTSTTIPDWPFSETPAAQANALFDWLDLNMGGQLHLAGEVLEVLTEWSNRQSADTTAAIATAEETGHERAHADAGDAVARDGAITSAVSQMMCATTASFIEGLIVRQCDLFSRIVDHRHHQEDNARYQMALRKCANQHWIKWDERFWDPGDLKDSNAIIPDVYSEFIGDGRIIQHGYLLGYAGILHYLGLPWPFNEEQTSCIASIVAFRNKSLHDGWEFRSPSHRELLQTLRVNASLRSWLQVSGDPQLVTFQFDRWPRVVEIIREISHGICESTRRYRNDRIVGERNPVS